MTDELACDCTLEPTLQRLYRKLGLPAVSKTRRIVGRLDIAQEIVHDVFVRLWQAKLRFENDRQAFLWIYKTCHNAAIDYLRTAAVRKERSTADGGVSLDIRTSSGSEASGMRDYLIEALNALPDTTAQVFVYREVDGMTQEEIAQVLGVSRKTVQRALVQLEAHFVKVRARQRGTYEQ